MIIIAFHRSTILVRKTPKARIAIEQNPCSTSPGLFVLMTMFFARENMLFMIQ